MTRNKVDSSSKQSNALKPKKSARSTRKPLSTLSVSKGDNSNNSQQPSCAKLDKRVKELTKSTDVAFGSFGDIMRSLRTKESKLLTDIDGDFIGNTQHSITWTMRSLLIDWVLNIQAQYKMMDETIFAVINYVDCYLSVHPVDKAKLQLVGVTAMNLAGKTYEVRPQSIHEWLYLSQGQYTKKEVLTNERKLLQTIDWNIFQVTPYNYSSSWMRILCAPAAVQFMFDFVIRVVYSDSLCLKHKVSHITSAVLGLAFVYSGRRHEIDTDLLIALAEHDPLQSDLMSTINDLVCSFLRREDSSDCFIMETYAGADDDKSRGEKYGVSDREFSIDGVDFKRLFQEHCNQSKSNKRTKKL